MRINWLLLLLLFPICALGANDLNDLDDSDVPSIQYSYESCIAEGSRQYIVFYINPSSWMFGVAAELIVVDGRPYWFSRLHSVDISCTDGRSFRVSHGAAEDNQMALYYHTPNLSHTLVFSAPQLATDLLSVIQLHHLEDGLFRVRLCVGTRNIAADRTRFTSGPMIESEWLELEVRKGLVWLVRYQGACIRRAPTTRAPDTSEDVYELSSPILIAVGSSEQVHGKDRGP